MKVGEDLSFQEGFIFWRLARFFIGDNGYRIVQLSKNQNELWLEKIENKETPLIRLLLHNLDWSNWMQRDIELTAANGESIRKQLNRRTISVLNIYVSPFPPVDDYHFRIEKPFFNNGEKTKVTSIIVDRKDMKNSFDTIFGLLQTSFPFSLKEDYSESDVTEEKQKTFASVQQMIQSEKAVFSNGKPFFTYVFLLIQVAVFLLMGLTGGTTSTEQLIRYGAKVNALILEGEWWRFFTPIFIHIGFLHLAMNSLALFYLGATIERVFGNARFLFIYLFAGFSGTLASFLFSSGISAGASGAIFGCFGALLFFGTVNPKLFFRTMGTNLLVVIIINLFFGFLVSSIDNAGHLGGLAGGFLAASIVSLPGTNKRKSQLFSFVIGLVLISGLLYYGFQSADAERNETSALITAREYIQQEQYEKAYDILKPYSSDQGGSEELYFYLSYAEIKTDRLDEAKAHLQTAVEKNPQFHEALYNLALLYVDEKDYEHAKNYTQQALDIKPNNNDYQQLLDQINQLEAADGA